MTLKLLLQAITKYIAGVIVVGILIFLPAGTFASDVQCDGNYVFVNATGSWISIIVCNFFGVSFNNC